MKHFWFKVMYRNFGPLVFILDYYLVAQQIAAVTPKKHSMKLIDERFETIDFEEDCDVVVLTFPTGYSTRAYEVADEFRKKGKTVVMADYHASVMPEEAKEHADSILIGEVELSWPHFLKDFQKGEIKPYYKQEKPVDPAIIPPANRELIKKFHRPLARIQATRGCPINCEFCRIPAFEGTTYRKRPVENVIKEIKSIRQKFLFFADGSLTLDPEYTKALFKQMKGLRKRFFCCGNADVLNVDDELLKLAKKAGCIAWYVGFESVNQNTIDLLNKKTNVVEKYKSVVQKIHDHGIAVCGSFIVGFDNDTFDDFDNIIDAMYDLKMDHIELNILTPFPGTPLFKRLDKEGRILTKNWFHYREGQSGTNIPFQPKNMTREELTNEGRLRIFDHWYGSKDINLKEYIRRRLSFFKEGLKIGFYPFMYRVFGYFFHL